MSLTVKPLVWDKPEGPDKWGWFNHQGRHSGRIMVFITEMPTRCVKRGLIGTSEEHATLAARALIAALPEDERPTLLQWMSNLGDTP